MADANLMRGEITAIDPVLKTNELVEVDWVDWQEAFHLVSPLFR